MKDIITNLELQGLATILLTGLCCTFFAYIHASFSIFLEYCMQPGHILFRYKKWIDFRVHKSAIYKIIGGCSFCTNFWTSLITFCILQYCTGLFPNNPLIILWFIAYVSQSSTFIYRL